MMIMIKSIAASTITLSYALVIFYMSLVSAGTLHVIYKRVGIGGDNLLHVLSFVLLAFLTRFMFSTKFYKKLTQSPRVWSVCTSAFLSVTIEIFQVFMPTRHASVLDLLLHAAGIFIFFVIDSGIDKYGKKQEFD
jgi:glycopeptide antibiotics resistance protein